MRSAGSLLGLLSCETVRVRHESRPRGGVAGEGKRFGYVRNGYERISRGFFSMVSSDHSNHSTAWNGTPGGLM